MLYVSNLKTGHQEPLKFPDLLFNGLNLTQILGGLLNGNEILQLLNFLVGNKSGFRAQIDESDYESIRSLCSGLNIALLKSEYYVEYVESKVIRGAYYTGRRTQTPKEGRRKVFVYFAKSKKQCAALRNAEKEGDDYEFGKRLGYPICCIKYYTKSSFPKKGDYVMNSIDLPTVSPYKFLNNVALWPFGIGMIDHFPCSPRCEKSMDLAQCYARTLMKIDRDYYEFIEEELKSMVVCSRNGSVVYSTDYSKNKDRIYINEIKGDPSDPLYKLIKKNDYLRFENSKELCVGNESLMWPNYKIIFYN